MFETYFAGYSTYSDGVPDEDEEANALDVKLGDLDVEQLEYRYAMADLSRDLRAYFPLLRDDQLEEAENLIKSFYMINQDKNRREEIRIKKILERKGIYR